MPGLNLKTDLCSELRVALSMVWKNYHITSQWSGLNTKARCHMHDIEGFNAGPFHKETLRLTREQTQPVCHLI